MQQHKFYNLGQGEIGFLVTCLSKVVAMSSKVSGVGIAEEKLTCMTTASKWRLKGEGEWHSIEISKPLNQGDIKWRIFRHRTSSGHLFESNEDVLTRNSEKSSWKNNTEYPLLSNLHYFESLDDNLRVEDNSFHFQLCYWGENLGELNGGCNEWRQNSNPVTSTAVEGFKVVSLDWAEDFGGLCKLEGPEAETSLISSCSNNARFPVGAKRYNDPEVFGVWGPQASGVDDIMLYVKHSLSDCGVFTASGKEEYNFPFKWEYSTFFFEGKPVISPWLVRMRLENHFQQRARRLASI